MEEALIIDIKRLRVLTPSDCDNMDGLVPDLSQALEETSCSRSSSGKNVKHERPWKRRFRSSSTYSNFGTTVKSSAVSDDSESSLDDKIRLNVDGYVSHPPTDSDDMNRKWQQQKLLSWRRTTNMVESDSVNENFHPAREHKRKRKFKRMAVDPQPSINDPVDVRKFLLSVSSKHSKCHKRLNSIQKIPDNSNDLENARGRCIQTQKLYCGKRKRSIREKSTEYIINEKKLGHSPASNLRNCAYSNQSMDCDNIGFCNYPCNGLSSSDESDNGFVTNDEGREADDEHSDVNPTCGISSDLQHSFCYLSACGKIQSSTVNQIGEIQNSDHNDVTKCLHSCKIENMQVESPSSKNVFRYEGTKRRRRTPPIAYTHVEPSTEDESTNCIRCKETHGVVCASVNNASLNPCHIKNHSELMLKTHLSYNSSQNS